MDDQLRAYATTTTRELLAYLAELQDDVCSMASYDNHKALEAAMAAGDQAAVQAALDAASSIGALRGAYDAQAHAVFHGVAQLHYGTVERRRGYTGQTVCLDCYRSTAYR